MEVSFAREGNSLSGNTPPRACRDERIRIRQEQASLCLKPRRVRGIEIARANRWRGERGCSGLSGGRERPL